MSEPNTQLQPNTESTAPQDTPPAQSFDYEKLASLITGKQNVTEDTVLKSYFKEQGLSADEMKEAINSFKEQKAKNTPDFSKMQTDLANANSARLSAEINQAATIEAIKQGVDVKSIPYLLKMADFKAVTDENGAIKAEALTNSIKTVLDDIPALKGVSNDGNGSGGWGERHKGSLENRTGVEEAFYKRNPKLK